MEQVGIAACFECGDNTPIYLHEFCSGTCPLSVPPGKEWKPDTTAVFRRALYFNSNEDDFCSAKCFTSWWDKQQL